MKVMKAALMALMFVGALMSPVGGVSAQESEPVMIAPEVECERYGCLYGHDPQHYSRDGGQILYAITNVALPDGPDGRFFVDVQWPGRYDPERRAAWDRVAMCESTQRWDLNIGLYDGGLQFHPNTWRAYGGLQYAPYAYQAHPEQQIDIAENVLRFGYGRHGPQGIGAWPHCGKRF